MKRILDIVRLVTALKAIPINDIDVSFSKPKRKCIILLIPDVIERDDAKPTASSPKDRVFKFGKLGMVKASEYPSIDPAP